MTITGKDITGGGGYRREGDSLLLTKNDKILPSYVEDAIDKAIIFMDQEANIGEPLSDDEKIKNMMNNRHFIVDEACRSNGRIDREYAACMLDTIIQKKFHLSQIKMFARLDLTGESKQYAEEMFEDLGMSEMATVGAMETLAIVCRAIIRWVMVHHETRTVKGIEDIKSPLVAWRLKDAITTAIKTYPMVEIEPRGFENDKFVKQFSANITETDLVLWNDNIWMTAIRGCEAFSGTPLTSDILRSAVPMFWMFEKPITLNARHYFDLERGKHECVGIVIMNTMEDFVRIMWPDSPGTEFKPDPNDPTRGHVTIDMDDPEARAVMEQAWKDVKSPLSEHSSRFLRPGFFVALIFMPLTGEVKPQARFLKPIYEDDIIPSENGLYWMACAAMKFLSLKYVSKDTKAVSNKELKTDRAMFKKIRKGKMQVPSIKVINLRRAERRTKAEDDADPTPKEKRHYSCHWFVEPHWRNQYYPSIPGNRIKRIWTYMKGDPSKPLKVHRETVFKAVR